MPPQEAIVVNLLLAAGLILFVVEAPVGRTWARLAAVLLLTALTAWYFLWRWQFSLPLLDVSFESLWPWFFFIAEMLATAYEVWSLFVLVRFTDHSRRADDFEQALRCEPHLPTIDVFIPTYNEPKEVLEETLRGALALDYPAGRVKIWFLDDGRRDWLRRLCSENGVGYFARSSNEHGKAGNLNHAFPLSEGDLILIIDADFILEPRFLYRTIGFLLYEEDIGLVQTPQRFRNPDPLQHNLLGTSAWTEEQHFFMTVVESARDCYDNAFCVGSGWVVKRTCVEELGGFPQGSLCEDLEISYALKGLGYRTLFLNEPLAFGLASESVPEYVKQRVRWCSGTLQHIYLKTGPFRAPGLSLLDRLFYLETIVYWLVYPFIVLLLVAPIVFWYTGMSAIPGYGEEAFFLLVPRFAAGYILGYWLSNKKLIPPITTLHKALPAFHLTAAIIKSLLKPFGAPFKVTLKGQSRAGVVVQWGFLWIFLVLAGALLAAMAINLTGYHEVVEVSEFTALDVFWSAYSLAVLLLCSLACIEQPRPSNMPRGETDRGSPLGTVKALAARLFA
jgi:cellulose synthase (UDP-forming)